MSNVIKVDNLAVAIKLINEAWPVLEAGFNYIKSNNITDADIAALNAQDAAAAKDQQAAIDASIERAKQKESK